MKRSRLSQLSALGALLIAAGAAAAQNPATAPAQPAARAITKDGVTLPSVKSWPSVDDVYAAWPADARRLGLEGYGTARCIVDKQGRTRDCVIEGESYQGMRFGAAALTLAARATFEPALNRDGQLADFSMPLTFNFVCRDRCMKLDPETLKRPLAVRVVWATAPTSDDVRSNYPTQVFQNNLTGDAVISCQFTNDNHLRNCQVGFEQPEGMGSGTAALALASRFKAKGANGSRSNYEVRIPFHFEMRDGRLATGAPEVVASPTSEEFRAAFPPAATTESGQARLACTITGAGALGECAALTETPPGQGFAAAALGISGKFAFNLWTPDGMPAVNSRVAVPVQFDKPPPPLTGIPLRLENPQWAQQPTPSDLARAYPERAMRLGQEGRAVVDCEVLPTGEVHKCILVSENPAGIGFGAAALSLTSKFRMKPMPIGGNIIMPSGARVRVPIDFRIK